MMSKQQVETTRAMAERVIDLAEEVEASGEASLDGAALQAARLALHQWIDGVIGVVVTPAFGRVTVIHPNGRESTISSPDLPYLMSAPVK
jgi:hypothetical protein